MDASFATRWIALDSGAAPLLAGVQGRLAEGEDSQSRLMVLWRLPFPEVEVTLMVDLLCPDTKGDFGVPGVNFLGEGGGANRFCNDFWRHSSP